MFNRILILVCTVLLLSSPVKAENKDKVMLVLDASGSMWGQIDGQSKIEIARKTFKNMLQTWPSDKYVGLVAYGHRTKGDCKDIETLIPVGPLNSESMLSTVNSITPKGKTPLSQSVKQAAQALKYTENKATVILISDGKETCNIDPCALGTELEKLGVDFTAHVIGFDVASLKAQAELKCLAENTGGQFLSAANASELNEALNKTVKAPPAPKPVPVAQKKPAPKGQITVTDKVVKGTELPIQLQGEPNIGGYVYLYKKGFEKHISYDYARTDKKEGGYHISKIRMPTDLGPYVLKWYKGNQLIAEAETEVVDAQVQLGVSKTATKGTKLKVQLKAPDGLDGYIYLFAKGKDKDLAYDYVRPHGTQAGYKDSVLQLPADLGNYTVKWVTKRHETLAAVDLEIVDAKVTLNMPQEAIMGTKLHVQPQAPDGLSGYVYLYVKGKEKHTAYDYIRANEQTGGYKISNLELPSQPGEYVVKWVTYKNEVLTENPLTITQAKVSLKVASEAPMGTELKVHPQGPEGLSGYIYLYKQGKDKHIVYDYIRAGGDTEAYKVSKLRLPSFPGDYVVKWVTHKKEILFEHPLKITKAEVSMDIADTAIMGTEVKIKPKGPEGLDGYFYLYAEGREKHITYAYVRPHEMDGYQMAKLRLPGRAGNYVIKWITSRKETLAEKTVVVKETAIQLKSNESGKAGEKLKVTLEAAPGLGGYIYLYPKGKEKHLTYGYVREHNIDPYQAVDLKLPDNPGDYVIKWVGNYKEVIAEKEIKVTAN